MKPITPFLFVLLLISVSLSVKANPPGQITLEKLINDRIYSYPLSSDNLLKLAAYFEMKGVYKASYDQMEMDFGSLGTISFFKDRLFLRTHKGQVFHLKPNYPDAELLGLVNDALRAMFESIPLMGNYNCHPAQIDFVDQHLADKNIEPFDKLYLRFILLKYGKYDAGKAKVEFRSAWLPSSSSANNSSLVRKYTTPQIIYLYPKVIRGYYEKIGGTVFIQAEKKTPYSYVIGQTSKPNVAAFKLFIQKLFVQSIKYIAQQETDRLQENVNISKNIESSKLTASMSSKLKPSAKSKKWEGPYDRDSWMIMMLTILRKNNTNVGEPEIIKHFVKEPYFDRLRSYMTREEQQAVDQYLKEN
ncbi:MAG: hypothetical protein AAFY71_16490 [Bacteroidota bacterium]